jgi:hypothetical protein
MGETTKQDIDAAQSSLRKHDSHHDASSFRLHHTATPHFSMHETTLQDQRAATAPHRSSRYDTLKTAALGFIHAQTCNAALPTRMDFDALRALTAPGYSHEFGPAYAVSQAPKLQGRFSVDAFIQHLEGMIPNLEGWEVEVTGTVVDEVGGSVVVRAGYWMQVKGADEEEKVQNDVVWWLEMEDGAEGCRVRKSTEMVDAGAAGRIRELMMRGKG